MTADIWPVAMATGHRPQRLADGDMLDWVTDELVRVALKLSTENATETFLSGLALGVDQIWGWAAAGTRRCLRAHMPFPQQADVWRDPELKAQWQQLVDYARATGGVRVYGDLDGVAAKDRKRVAVGLLHQRNAGMIEETVAAGGVCVAVLRSSKLDGGTRSAYDRAKGSVPIVRLDPDRRTVTISRPENQATSNHHQETLPI